MDTKKWQENSRKFAKLLAEFKVTNNISNEDLVKFLVINASEYQALYNKDTAVGEINDELINLYDILEKVVIAYIQDHPNILSTLIYERDTQMSDPNWVKPDVYPHNTFGLAIEDIISKAQGIKTQTDLYCGFTVGNKNISVF